MSFKLSLEKGNEHYVLEHIKAKGFSFWLGNEKSEGMSVTEEDLYKLFDEFFKENF